MIRRILLTSAFAAALSACSIEDRQALASSVHTPEGMYLLCDFESRVVEFGEANATISIVPNPLKDEVNPSEKCGRITLKGGTWDCVGCSPTCPMDFTACSTISLSVISPRPGAAVSLKLVPLKSGICESVIVSCATRTSGCWEELVFDLSEYRNLSNYLKKIYIMCDGGVKTTSTWYIDNLEIPDDDISSLSLFKRAAPPMLPDRSEPWMCNSIANPQVLRPDQTLDGRWWLLVRGGDSRKSHLGYYTQDADKFNPLGPWDYYKGNPVIPAGWYGTEDEWQAIDPCGLTEDGMFYYFYKGQAKDRSNTVLIATTRDGKHFTPVEKPWKRNCGIADIHKWNGHYYLYVARRIYIFDNITSGDDAAQIEILQKGGGPSNCDWYSINGGKIFRLEGFDKWFLAYQAGTCNNDFPKRFHLAYSDDMIHWTKVDNPQPLFTRGKRGEWDQGAIWAPSVFEYGGTLYMYYEGWGTQGDVPDRDKSYFLPGHSQIGIASCSREDFLKWCGLNQ